MKLYISIAFLLVAVLQVFSHDCTPPLRCQLPVKPGDCHESRNVFYYDTRTNQCRPFTYTGCNGNVNRFQTKQLCENTCLCKGPSTTAKPLPWRCNLRLNPGGNCSYAIRRFYYDSSANECRSFLYTGCGGNVNNFRSKELCESVCIPH